MEKLLGDGRQLAANEKHIWQQIFRDVKANGKETAPRGKPILEVENYHYTLPPYVRFCTLTPRQLKLDYIKAEWQWFLGGDPYDLRILKHSNIWKNIVLRGRLNSNYGLYFFRQEGLYNVVKMLGSDKDSRRACITLLSQEHVTLLETKDVPCTAYINFRIREDRLNMSVHMRSQDAVYGMGNDAVAFSLLHEYVHNYLLVKYPDLLLGDYHHTADSFHIYERHYKMLDELVADDCGFDPIVAPRVNGYEEVDYTMRDALAQNRGPIPGHFMFTEWLFDGVKLGEVE